MATGEDILRSALDLPEDERARLAAALLDSLEGPPDADAEDAWAEEVAERLRSLESGAAKTISTSDAIARARNRIQPGD